MTNLRKHLVSFGKDESGASAAEYALLLAIIGIGIVVAAQGLGGAISGALNRATNCINAGSTGTC